METKELKQLCAEKLKGIAANVVSKDRKDAMVEFDVSYHTVLRYLKGEVKDLDFGVKLFEFINDRIEKRKEALTV